MTTKEQFLICIDEVCIDYGPCTGNQAIAHARGLAQDSMSASADWTVYEVVDDPISGPDQGRRLASGTERGTQPR